MISLKLDAQGRLLYFERIPDQKLSPGSEHPAPDWNPLFTAAGLDQTQFQSTESLWTWLAASDTRAAWSGTWPGGSRPLRVEAAALRGKPVAFSLIGPWETPDRMPARESSNSDRGEFLILVGISLAVAIGTWVLVNRNAKKGGGDAAGATRLAGWVRRRTDRALDFPLPHRGLHGNVRNVPDRSGHRDLLRLCSAIYVSCIRAARTQALAQTMISWSAVLTGHWRDPIVGRDVLAGAALAIAVLVINGIADMALRSTDPPNLGSTDVLLGIRGTLAVYFRSIPHGIRDTLLFFFVIFVLRVLLRNQWLATGGFVLVFSALQYFQGNQRIQDVVASLVVFSLVAGLVFRFGLLALATFIVVQNIVISTQVTASTSAWYFGNDVLILASVLALAGWGFHTSIAGRKLWKQDLLD